MILGRRSRGPWAPSPGRQPSIVAMAVASALPVGAAVGIEALWTEGQRRYATLSPSGRFEQVEGAGHHIDRDDPNRVVKAIDALSLEALG